MSADLEALKRHPLNGEAEDIHNLTVWMEQQDAIIAALERAERDAEIEQRVEEIAALEADLAAAREREKGLRQALERIEAGEDMGSWAKTVAHEALVSRRSALARKDGDGR